MDWKLPSPPTDPQSLARRAQAQARAGHWAEAADLLQQSLAAGPAEGGFTGEMRIQALLALINCLEMLAHWDRALDAAAQLIAVDPQSVILRIRQVTLLQKANRPNDAVDAAHRAVNDMPNDAAAHRLLASVLERLNRLPEAEAAVNQALALAPADRDARVLAARIVRLLKRPREAVEMLQPLVQSAGEPVSQARTLNELGHALDALGDHPAAFNAFTKSLEAQALTPQAKAVPRIDWKSRLESVARAFTADRLARFAAMQLPDPGLPRMAFLVGFPRSGTTMLEQVLAAHRDVVTSDERSPLAGVVEELQALAGEPVTGQAADLGALIDRMTPERLQARRGMYLNWVRSNFGDAVNGRLLIDKLPLNIIRSPLLNVLFPSAQVLVALRDPRDVCLSCLMQMFTPSVTMVNFFSLERAAGFYAEVMGLWLAVRDRLTFPMLELRYEDTVRDLEAQARRVLEWLGLPWDDQVLRFHEKARDRHIVTPSYVAVTQAANTGAMRRWEKYRDQLAPVLPALEPFVQAFGYSTP